MLKRLYVDNYRCLVNFEARFAELTLLIGPNGSGKSSVLDVVSALRELVSGRSAIVDQGAFPARTLTRWHHANRQTFELTVELNRESLTYRLELEHQPGSGRARVALERLLAGDRPLFAFEGGEVQLYRDDHSEGPSFPANWSKSALALVVPGQDNTRLTRFLEYVGSFQVCGLQPQRFATECTREDAIIERDGRNFSAWYRHVLQETPSLVSGLEGAIAEAIDGFEGIRLERLGPEARAFVVAFDHGAGRYELRLDELSDGQKALIALYALVHLAGMGKTLFLDEPDNYIALAEIQPWLIEISDACGETIPQAVLCSHHPELIDYLGADKTLCFERSGSGAVTARRLDRSGAVGDLKLSEIVARGWER